LAIPQIVAGGPAIDKRDYGRAMKKGRQKPALFMRAWQHQALPWGQSLA
jgi:hypothetical protein